MIASKGYRNLTSTVNFHYHVTETGNISNMPLGDTPELVGTACLVAAVVFAC
jgi:predicted permease